tara:strand:- start:22 stop:1059 length:1038 start_codon:yes stop_codon:yes gene_type:complete
MLEFTRVLELHNKDEFEIYIYDFGLHQEDEYTIRIKSCADSYQFVENLSNPELVKLARQDDLDIGVDLMGYTKNHRAMIFSQRIAPIQVTYLDYPGTTGSDSMDFIIADQVLVPKEDEKFYTEKVIRMPYSHQPTDDTLEPSNKTFERSDLGIEEDSFVFCNFGKSQKIQRREFTIWMRLLLRRENSVLWLLESNAEAKANLIAEAKRNGVDASRLIFSKTIAFRDHMSRQSCADLVLDTFNFSGGVMTSLALKSGLPVLTLPGKSNSSRISACDLTALELHELIASSEEDYEEKAFRLSESRKNTLKLREKIIGLKESAAYFSSKQYCVDLESKFKEIISNFRM